jgi:hypothetical protein
MLNSRQKQNLWYTHKTTGFETSGFKTSGFKTSETSGLQNVRSSKRQVFETSGFKTSLLVKLQNVRFQRNTLTLPMLCLVRLGQ